MKVVKIYAQILRVDETTLVTIISYTVVIKSYRSAHANLLYRIDFKHTNTLD